MAAAGVVKATSYQPTAFPGGRSNDFAAVYTSPHSFTNNNSTPKIATSVASSKKLPTFTSIKSLRDESRGASSPSSRQRALRSTLRNIDTKMSSSARATATTTTSSTALAAPAATTKRSEQQHAKLHKRGSSGSSLPTSPPLLNGTHSHFPTPYATYENEPFPDITTTPSSSTTKIKPYLRKISSAGREDPEQGRLDLSKSVSENEALTGLGIQDFGRPEGGQNGRRTPHARTTSVGSTVSTGSGSFRPSQPFIHPMRQMPNMPYTPLTDASSLNDEETRESSDIVTDDDVQVGQVVRPGRSTSLSSNAQTAAPTPLSQSHTAADLGYIPKLTSSSQTNLSIKSSRSMKSLKSKLSRPRADTNHSFDYVPSASSRTSLDNAFSFVSRRSDLDPQQSREERIRAARRKFEAKEANKDRKMEKEELKRRQSEYAKNVKRQQQQQQQQQAVSQRRESNASAAPGAGDRPRIPKERSKKDLRKRSEELRSMRYDESVVTALPRQGTEPGKSEKLEREEQLQRQRRQYMADEETSSHAGWTRFSTWLQTRLLSCGGKGS